MKEPDAESALPDQPGLALLHEAVVDITILACLHAALRERPHGDVSDPPRPRRAMRHEVHGATLAYIDVLARARTRDVEAGLLQACRVAAEQQMPRALGQQARLASWLMARPGGLQGLAAARHDLWRLAHLALHLRLGTMALRACDTGSATDRPRDPAARLRRRLRKALVAYARQLLAQPADLAGARQAALQMLGRRAVGLARRLARIEAALELQPARLRLGLLQPLRYLELDWTAR